MLRAMLLVPVDIFGDVGRFVARALDDILPEDFPSSASLPSPSSPSPSPLLESKSANFCRAVVVSRLRSSAYTVFRNVPRAANR